MIMILSQLDELRNPRDTFTFPSLCSKSPGLKQGPAQKGWNELNPAQGRNVLGNLTLTWTP